MTYSPMARHSGGFFFRERVPARAPDAWVDREGVPHVLSLAWVNVDDRSWPYAPEYTSADYADNIPMYDREATWMTSSFVAPPRQGMNEPIAVSELVGSWYTGDRTGPASELVVYDMATEPGSANSSAPRVSLTIRNPSDGGGCWTFANGTYHTVRWPPGAVLGPSTRLEVSFRG